MDLPAAAPTLRNRLQRAAAAAVQGFRAYAGWLVEIGWRRFALLSLLLLIAANLLEDLPPFSWHVSERPRGESERAGNAAPEAPVRYEISIDAHGVRIGPLASGPAASGPAGVGAAPAAASSPVPVPAPPAPPARAVPAPPLPSASIALPPGADADAVREAIEEARDAVTGALHDAEAAGHEAAGAHRPIVVRLGDDLVTLTLTFIVVSAIVKINYRGRLQAEVKAAQATETAESESLKRQVVEARMAAMQAQVEPHFLFNTLASIDHLIEVDPPRASVMQRHLIALLRAAMPTMREANAQGVADLGRELAVVRPYLEILALRMEERLQATIDVPDGLLSAQIPPMMIQSLVENAVKHGLEPKPEGGRLQVKAEVMHGQLAVTVADTGLGFGRAATAGTGVGLANIRERLQLVYGRRASLTIAENTPGGTRVTITLPYAPRPDATPDPPAAPPR